MDRAFQRLSINERRIVVSIDFGTTFSGLAWSETKRPDHQNVIENWPTASAKEGKSSPKVPTELRSVANGFQWGFQIPSSAKRNKYFKLRLDDPSGSTTDTKSPEELTRLYLSYLYTHMKYSLEKSLSASTVWSTPIDYVITVPAIWTEAAKQKTLTAAEKAGFKSSKKTYLVSEPEAAAIYTLNNLRSSTLGVQRSFVVCDAGGGTVDCISYQIVKLSPRLTVKETTKGTGAKCGSSMLNKRFRRYIKQKFGEEYWADDDRLREAMDKFEQFKKDFTPQGEPLSLRIEMGTNAKLGVRRNRWTMDQSEMESKIFDPIIKDTIGLVKEQISATGNSVSAVLLVGGFGQSKYLKDRVKKALSSSVQVLQPSNGWTAVVQGAAMFGLRCVNENYSKLHVTSRTARKHYGVLLSMLFDPAKHNITKRCET
ncbi:hypothetical protein Egran_05928 [Elaphomyces granulatus]|uniref:Actin-like ATPase domain-containing protein n=1 Tax=Elaphomyces granulatus TaxID=519963 RepID=A0A232LQ76_9EURO|nr:hypothetical protein Egran_05928 [Elaphomyces granulatus]